MRPETRDQIEALRERRTQLIEQFPSKPSGLSWCAEHTQIADEVATAIYKGLAEDLGAEPELAIIAAGGYGRRELCVRSDIDITVVPGDETSPELDAVIRRVFQEIHWAYATALRLEVGYAYRLISDAPGLDAKTRTGLLDMRLLAGSETLFRNLDEALIGTFPAGEFVLSKIQERESMYRRHHDTPLVNEPQLKEGAGGLRDFHCARWIGEAIGERAARPNISYDCVMRYRNLLHHRSGKAQDRLSRARQVEIAEALGITPSDIVAELTQAGQDLYDSYIRAKEKLHEARFYISPGVVSVAGEVRILPNCSAGAAASGIAIATKLNLRISDLPAHADRDEAGPSALFALSSGEKVLRNLDRCTLLQQILPQLTDCRNLGGDNSGHVFTVMEHTLRVIRNLDSLANPPPVPTSGDLSDIRAAVIDIEPLYLAALLHDVGKKEFGIDHAVDGARIAREVVVSWKLDSSTADMVVWLVREHLTMANFLRNRDIEHPSTSVAFARFVENEERLKLLTLLTWADISAVGPDVMTRARQTFLRQLHDQALALLQNGSFADFEPSQSRNRLLRQLQKEPAEEVERFIESLPAYYLTGTNADVVKLHMKLSQRAAAGDSTIEHLSVPDVMATEITVCTLDTPGLLSHLLGVLYAQDLSLLGLRACTTSSSPPVAIDVFTVSFGGKPVPTATINQTSHLLRQVISGQLDVDELLVAKTLNPHRPQPVDEWFFMPGQPGILELRTPRGRGMPFRFSRMFASRGWNTLAARVGQWAGSGTASFYLVGKDGQDLGPQDFLELEGFDKANERKATH
jgi:[protein-PII] uridylyltransferase